MPELDLDDLAIFVRVVDHGGFAALARELKAPTSTVSRAIARLEATAGTRLFQRTTRTMRPTSEGRELYAAVAPAVAALRTAARSLEPASRTTKGRLRVSMPTDLASSFLSDVLVAFAERHPLVSLDVVLSNRHTNLVEGGFDVAVRAASRLESSSLVARKLGQVSHGLYASPSYLAKHGAPSSAEELVAYDLVVFRAEELARTWTLIGSAGKTEVSVKGRIGGDDFAFVRAIVRSGGGIALLPSLNAAADVASGQLVRVLPELSAKGATLYVVYPSAKNVPARVIAFRDFVLQAFASWEKREDAIS